MVVVRLFLVPLALWLVVVRVRESRNLIRPSTPPNRPRVRWPMPGKSGLLSSLVNLMELEMFAVLAKYRSQLLCWPLRLISACGGGGLDGGGRDGRDRFGAGAAYSMSAFLGPCKMESAAYHPRSSSLVSVRTCLQCRSAVVSCKQGGDAPRKVENGVASWKVTEVDISSFWCAAMADRHCA